MDASYLPAFFDVEGICRLAKASEPKSDRLRIQAEGEMTVCIPFLLGSDRAGFPGASLTLMEISQSKHVLHLHGRNWFVLVT